MTKITAIAAALVAACLGGWFWGASGRSATSGALQAAELRSDLLDARAATLDARVALYNVNFGEAIRHLEDARGLLRRAEPRLKSLGRENDLKETSAALAAIDEAQRMAGKLDQGANTRTGDAARILSNLLAVR